MKQEQLKTDERGSQTVIDIPGDHESLQTHSQPTAEKVDKVDKVDIESKTGPSTIQKNTERETMAILCHELRNPLNGMLGNAQLMRAGLDGLLASIEEHRGNPDMQCDVSVLSRELQKSRKRLKSIESCGKDQLTILNHFLDLSKLEQTGAVLESKPFAILRDTLNPLLSIYSALSEEKGITLLTILPETDPWLMGDAYRLKQILTNLLSNALKFAEPVADQSACVELSLFMLHVDNHQQLSFKIKNTGQGLSAQQIEQLFKPYAQSDPSITRRFGGTGLGLVVCKQLLALMKGEIVCTSSVSEQWVQFEVQLVLPVTSTPRHQRGDREQKTLRSQPKTRPDLNAMVLIVEDNKVNQKILVRMLKKFRCVADVAENGRQAVALCSENMYSLVLMDIQMPIMNGLEATQAIRAQEKTRLDFSLTPIPIIGLSADALTEQRDTALKAGMNDYLTKPILEKDLYDKIAQYARQTPVSSVLLTPPGTPRSGGLLPSGEQKSERTSPKLDQGSIVRHSPSPLLFTQRLAPVREDSVGRLLQASRGSRSSSFESAPSDGGDEGSPTPRIGTDHFLLFARNPEIDSLSARVAELERALQQPVRESYHPSIVGIGILDNKETVVSLAPFSRTSTESSPLEMKTIDSLYPDPVSGSSQSSGVSDDALAVTIHSMPPDLPLPGDTPLENSAPIPWMQRLAEVKENSIEKAQVMLQAMDHYFRTALADDGQSIIHVSVTVSTLPGGQLKQWIEHLEDLYRMASTLQQSWIAATALGHWQSLRDQAVQIISQGMAKNSLLQVAESNLMTWKQRSVSLEEALSSTTTRLSGCCMVM